MTDAAIWWLAIAMVAIPLAAAAVGWCFGFAAARRAYDSGGPLPEPPA